MSLSPVSQKSSNSRVRRPGLAVGLGCILWGGLPLTGLLFWGRSLTEKILTEFCLPMGLAWSMLWAGMLIAIGRGASRRTVTIWLIAWLGFTLVGNRWLASQASHYWEREQYDFRPGGIYDLIVVLGGGLSTNERHEPQVGDDGQRVLLAVQQFHAGKVKRIVVTGSAMAGYSSGSVAPSESAQKLIESLGVPSDVIQQLPGINTTEEMKSLKGYLAVPGREAWRVGLVTSAFHMPRALRLARAQQLNLEPLPTAFRSRGPAPLSPATLLPDVEAVKIFRLYAREILGGLVSR